MLNKETRDAHYCLPSVEAEKQPHPQQPLFTDCNCVL